MDGQEADKNIPMQNGIDDKLDKKEEQLGLYAALSYIVIVLGVGIPLWWNTTNTYRVQLPYDALNTIDAVKIIFPCKIEIFVSSSEYNSSLSEYITTKLVSDGVRYTIDVRNYSDHTFGLIDSCDVTLIDEMIVMAGYNVPGSIYIWVLSCEHLELPIIIGKHRSLLLQDSSLLSSVGFLNLIHTIVGEEDLKEDVYSLKYKISGKHIRRLQPHSGIDVTFSLVNPEPKQHTFGWNIKDSTIMYMKNIVESLKPLSEINLSAQSVYFTSLQVPIHSDNKNSHYFIKDQDLPLTINPIEGHLSSFVSTNPVLNFILYITPEKLNPLYIRHDAFLSDNFITPRWGGVVLWNPRNGSKEIDMKLIMSKFMTQLRLLLGLNKIEMPNTKYLDLGLKGLSGLEFDFLVRIRILERIASSQNTLKSLSELLGKISNIVINDDVGLHVHQAVSFILKCFEQVEANKLADAVQSSMNAFVSSEKAFFDPSMLSLLYFPDDQKYAIYVPLFLPVGIPIIVSCYRILRSLVFNVQAKQSPIA